MNPVEIEQAISELVQRPFDGEEFPYAFLEAFGNNETTIKRLRSGSTNSSDIGGVLQRNNMHLKVCPKGKLPHAIRELRNSPATRKGKVRFIIAVDGQSICSEDLATGEEIILLFGDISDKFGFFLPLAGIDKVQQISENSFDIKATGRLNKLYVELLNNNPEWEPSKNGYDIDLFMARLIFCFFAQDTGIFSGKKLFSTTIDQICKSNPSNAQNVISEIFYTMNIKIEERSTKSNSLSHKTIRFPYVNGGLFEGASDVPKFNRISLGYLLNIGGLDWQKINPDIFGSMIQAVTDEKERSKLGMHYTSVSNILKVLNPLFLNELREKLDEAGNNDRKLKNLRTRMAKIRIFDPACGSGNFLVIAYKEIRSIEAQINKRRGELDRKSDILLDNFRGIEIEPFPAQIARLALNIAQYQCDMEYRGRKDAMDNFLPLDSKNWVFQGDSLIVDWLSLCPPTEVNVQARYDDLFVDNRNNEMIDFKNKGGETYICGNPPYRGAGMATSEQKAALKSIFRGHTNEYRRLDYVAAWFMKAVEYGKSTSASAAFVTTNSLCQGNQVQRLWPLILQAGYQISFAHTSFGWKNLASEKANVTVAIVGISMSSSRPKYIYSRTEKDENIVTKVKNISPYLISGDNIVVKEVQRTPNDRSLMVRGDTAADGGGLILSKDEMEEIVLKDNNAIKYIRPYVGAADFVRGEKRFCIWICDEEYRDAKKIEDFLNRFQRVSEFRSSSSKDATKAASEFPYRFTEINSSSVDSNALIVPRVTSERREFIQAGLFPEAPIVNSSAFVIYGSPMYNLAIISSKLHRVWISTVCGKLKTDIRYSNTLGWNTFPLPIFTDKMIDDLGRCAEAIILERESHFPMTISELYTPNRMPERLKEVHDYCDETIERIFIGRKFKNDTERLTKLFELYSESVSNGISDL